MIEIELIREEKSAPRKMWSDTTQAEQQQQARADDLNGFFREAVELSKHAPWVTFSFLSTRERLTMAETSSRFN